MSLLKENFQLKNEYSEEKDLWIEKINELNEIVENLKKSNENISDFCSKNENTIAISRENEIRYETIINEKNEKIENLIRKLDDSKNNLNQIKLMRIMEEENFQKEISTVN